LKKPWLTGVPEPRIGKQTGKHWFQHSSSDWDYRGHFWFKISRYSRYRWGIGLNACWVLMIGITRLAGRVVRIGPFKPSMGRSNARAPRHYWSEPEM